MTDQKIIFVNAQKIVEDVSTDHFIHPYTLNLDTIGICLQNLVALKVLEQERM